MSVPDDNSVLELFGLSTRKAHALTWPDVVHRQLCPFTNTKCFKVRKSAPNVSIGTCAVRYGRDQKNIIICPNRLLERRQVFTDSLHLLTLHEPGNELHVVPEVTMPGGSVDYFLVSARGGVVKDFVAIEFQTLDTTGTVWPERQRLLRGLGIRVARRDVASAKGFGMNWKMTAKTILVQLHHKVDTLEQIGKHFVLVLQDYLLHYLQREFSFDHLADGRVGDSVHIHGYALLGEAQEFRLQLSARRSTDTADIAVCLGLQAETKVELEAIIAQLEGKMSADTLLAVG